MSRTAKLFICCSLIFLFVQWFLHQRAEDTASQEELESPETNSPSIHSVSYINIANLSVVCHKYSLPLLLVDPRILQQIITGVGHQSKCKFLCHQQSISYFAVEQKFFFNQEEFFSDLDKYGFSCFVFRQHTPQGFHFPGSSQLVTHFEVQRSGHSILVSLLYERGALIPGRGDFWLGKLKGNPLQVSTMKGTSRCASNEVIIGREYSLWKRFKTSKVTIDAVPLRAPTFPEAFVNNLRDSKFIECNTDAANQYHERHPKDETSEAEEFRQSARSLLRKAKSALDDLGVPFWLSSGTCLGWFRQCDFIPYSKDVDIGIFAKDYHESITNYMQNNGLMLKYSFGKVEDSFELSFVENDVKLDIFFFYEEEDYVWNGGTQLKTGNKYKYIFKKFDLCWTEFEGLSLRVPCDTETYIEANYGKSWREPVKQWNWKQSPPNVQENGQWPKSEWAEVMQAF